MNREDIISKLERIETKLDEIIKALHEYDDDQIQHCEYSGLPSVKAYDEEAANERMDVIGQNGNTGEHYENEIINNPATINTHNVEKLIGGHGVPNSVVMDKKKRDKRKYYKPKAK
jgi:vacuolar-type H+-ATPase subunit H